MYDGAASAGTSTSSPPSGGGTPQITSFTDHAVLVQTVSFPEEVTRDDQDDAAAAAAGGEEKANVQPWEYYEAAVTATTEPTYRVEPAKSGNAQCSQTSATYRRCAQIWKTRKDKKTGEEKPALVNPKIAKGEVRIGVYDDKGGSYGRWVHLEVRCYCCYGIVVLWRYGVMTLWLV